MTPTDRTIVANRLRHHLLDWGGDGPLVLLLHGFLEHAHAWDDVAPLLVDAGFRVVALDWRGHGDSEWIGAGGYYHFADYTADLAFLLRELGGHAALVGHSMGASAALAYTGTEPARVTALVCVEALGPPDSSPDGAPDRFAGWVGDLARAVTRPRRSLSLDAAVARLRDRFPRFPADAARRMAEHGTRDDGTGRRVWKFDPLHQTRSPQPYYVAQASAFWRRVTCPVLYVEGEESGFALEPADTDRRLAALRAARAVIRGAAHHPHLECPKELAGVLIDFLKRPALGRETA